MLKIPPLVVVFGPLLASVAHSQVPVFDTSAGAPLLALSVSEGEIVADDVSLSTAGASVSSMEVFLVTYSAVGPVTADISAALYADNGFGAPGSLLWSETKTGLPFGSTASSLRFENIDTTVNRDFFWSVSMNNVIADPDAIWGPRLATAANVTPAGTSTDPTFFYTDRTGTGFVYTSITGADSTLGVRISGTPIPEPATAVSLGLGTLALCARRRRGRP